MMLHITYDDWHNKYNEAYPDRKVSNGTFRTFYVRSYREEKCAAASCIYMPDGVLRHSPTVQLNRRSIFGDWPIQLF